MSLSIWHFIHLYQEQRIRYCITLRNKDRHTWNWMSYSGVRLSFYTYYISPIEMRSLWTELKYIKSAARVLDRDCVNKRGLDLSKEVLWVSVGQRASDLQAVKVGGQKKLCLSAHCGRSGFEPGRSAEFFFDLQLWQPVDLMPFDLFRKI